jgi:hypothetical protein
MIAGHRSHQTADCRCRCFQKISEMKSAYAEAYKESRVTSASTLIGSVSIAYTVTEHRLKTSLQRNKTRLMLISSKSFYGATV